MIEYEIHRAGFGKNYSMDEAIKMSLDAVMRDCNFTEVDWAAFSKHIRIETYDSRPQHGVSVTLFLHFDTDTDAIYFKMQHGDNLNSKLLPDKHFHAKNLVEHSAKSADVIVGDGQD